MEGVIKVNVRNRRLLTINPEGAGPQSGGGPGRTDGWGGGGGAGGGGGGGG